MLDVLRRELVYINYYFMVQLRQITGYWVLGMVVGSLVSVFAKDAIHNTFARIRDKKWGLWGVVPASLLGVASPLCMYGTIPIAASFSRAGMRHDWLAAFMMSSVLLNPQLIMYSTALGPTALIIRLVSCTVCGVVAGLVVHGFYKDRPFFRFDGFEPGPATTRIRTCCCGSFSTWAGTSGPRGYTSCWVCCCRRCFSGTFRRTSSRRCSVRPTRASGY